MAHIHKKFTDEQVKDLLQRYLDKHIKRSYIQEILGIKICRVYNKAGSGRTIWNAERSDSYAWIFSSSFDMRVS